MKVFGISFAAFSAFFCVAYFSAVSNGAPGLAASDLPLIKAMAGVLIAVSVFSFWATMIVDCLSTSKPINRVAWVLSLLFFSWFAAIIYFFKVYSPNTNETGGSQN